MLQDLVIWSLHFPKRIVHGSKMGKFKDKSEVLRDKCLAIEKQNMRLLNRIYHVKKMMKSAQRDRKAIMERLDRYNDNYRSFDTFFDADVLKDSSVLKPMKMTAVAHKKAKNSKNISDTKQNEAKQNSERQSNVPKKPVNAYIIYCQQTRNEILREQPEINHQELTKILSKRWNQLRPDQKQIYYQFYEQDKERYENELEEYTEANQKSRKYKQPSEQRLIASARSNATISQTLNSLTDPSNLSSGYPLAQIPSPTLAHEDNPFRITNIPSPSFQ
eukprot:gene9208-10182_t